MNDDKFCVDGIWYVLEKSGETYTKVRYADVDDKVLVQVGIDTTTGIGTYKPWGLTFKFTNRGTEESPSW